MTSQTQSEKDRVVIFDTTLRDGEQCPGATMTFDEKLEVAELLDDMGVDSRGGNDDADREVSWTRRFFAALDDYREGVYVNFLGAGEGTERIREAYGPGVYERLVEAKTKYDPGNVFHHNQNIRPRSG